MYLVSNFNSTAIGKIIVPRLRETRPNGPQWDPESADPCIYFFVRTSYIEAPNGPLLSAALPAVLDWQWQNLAAAPEFITRHKRANRTDRRRTDSLLCSLRFRSNFVECPKAASVALPNRGRGGIQRLLWVSYNLKSPF